MKLQVSEVEVAPFDLHPSLAQQRLGKFDPTARRGADWFEKVYADRDGRVVSWRLVRTETGLRVEVRSEGGTGAESFLSQFPLADGCDGFQPEHPLLRRLGRTFCGLRLFRVPWLFDVAAGAVLQQRVRFQEAYNGFRRIAEKWGTRSVLGVAFPSAHQLAAVPAYQLEAVGIDGKRARALAALAREEVRHGFFSDGFEHEVMLRRLARISGIGPWTTGMIAGFGIGDPDAVPVGDLHLPSLVTGALAGEPEGTDERMLELLEPYSGQRFRVIRLLSWAERHAPQLLARRIRV